MKTNLPAITVEVGKRYAVGEFFWTNEETCIGFDHDARHGHQLSFGGSMDVGDLVEVLGIEGNMAVVKSIKSRTPYGAPCPHGMIFTMPVTQIASWPSAIHKLNTLKAWRQNMLNKYVKDEDVEDAML
jgi:hypothetical protein